MSEDSYADAPVSVSELRSDRSKNGADWTPRDVLVAMLREIDRGELKPTAMVICYCEPAAPEHVGAQITGFKAACPNPLSAYGMLVDTLLKIGHTVTDRGR